MTPSEVFSIANFIVLPMWLLMLFLPKWNVTGFLMNYKIVPVLLSIMYAVYVIKRLIDSGMPHFQNLDSIMILFTDQEAVLAGWIHYLAFDLVVGMWLLQENEKLQLHQLIMIPCLLATFMFGPLGFLLFIIIRSSKTLKSSKSYR